MLILYSQPSDTHPLLNEPYPQHNYGAVGDNARSSPQVDPEEIRKQRDALERLCAATSEYAQPPDTTHRSTSEDVLTSLVLTAN